MMMFLCGERLREGLKAGIGSQSEYLNNTIPSFWWRLQVD